MGFADFLEVFGETPEEDEDGEGGEAEEKEEVGGLAGQPVADVSAGASPQGDGEELDHQESRVDPGVEAVVPGRMLGFQDRIVFDLAVEIPHSLLPNLWRLAPVNEISYEFRV